jgi:uncharacterized RDD family membrane protein YckC
MAAITVLKENVPHGPYTRAEVADKLAYGEITLDSLAFIEGLSLWTPLRDVLAKVDAANPPAPQAAPTPPVATMPIGTGYGDTASVAPAGAMPIGTGYSYAATMQPPTHLVYAGFWLRFFAWIIDYIIVYAALMAIVVILSMIVGMAAGLSGRIENPDQISHNPLLMGLYFLVLIGLVIARWLYFALQESSGAQATLGKRALGIQVTDRQGNRIGFGRATGRYFGKIISGLIFCIGFMMAGWTERKQALHDMLADTLVVRKPGQ